MKSHEGEEVITWRSINTQKRQLEVDYLQMFEGKK